VLPLVLAVGAYVYFTTGGTMSTDNAYVRAPILGVSTDVSGIVASVAVRDNQLVAAGDELFRLDDEPFRLTLMRAEAQLGTVRNDLAAQKANYRDVQEQIAQAQIGEALRQLTHTVVRAPIAGIVTQVPAVQPGQYLQASAPAFSLVAADVIWVEAYPKEGRPHPRPHPGRLADGEHQLPPGVLHQPAGGHRRLRRPQRLPARHQAPVRRPAQLVRLRHAEPCYRRPATAA
jgi:multidrug resistance efflux pump